MTGYVKGRLKKSRMVVIQFHVQVMTLKRKVSGQNLIGNASGSGNQLKSRNQKNDIVSIVYKIIKSV